MVPLFSSSSYHTAISENVPTGSDVILVNASDGDVGQNGVIRYSIHTVCTYMHLKYPVKRRGGGNGMARTSLSYFTFTNTSHI